MDYLESLPFSSISGALEYQSKQKPNNKAILYPDITKNCTEYAILTYKQYNNLTNHLAEKISKYLPLTNESITCGLLAVGGLEYLLSEYALLKLSNVIMFPISARNSPSAIEHLLKETKTYLLLTTSFYLPMIEKIQQENSQLQSLKILLLDHDDFLINNLLKYKDIQSSFSSNIIKSNEELNKIVVILHSSGSTSHPKPIYLTNRYFLISYSSYLSINKDFWNENDIVLTWGALFHLLSFNGTIRCILTGCAYALPLCVSFPPKPDELLNNIQIENGITALVTVPSLLEQLIRELLLDQNQHIGLKPLQKLKFIIYAGAGCPDDLCKVILENNIVLLSAYGSTETGLVLLNNFNPYDKRWKFMRLPLCRQPYTRIEKPMNAQNPNEKILIHLPNDPYLAENISNQSDGSYIVGDILLEDPPNSGFYRILGRQDDTLVHITGEKTNPVPIEHTIQCCSLVKRVVVIGHNQFCTAALIELDQDKIKNLNKNQIEDEIWKYVQEANKDAPSHSRLVKQLIHILSNDEILPITHKGNLQRQKINQLYSSLISQIYDQFLNEQYQKEQEKKNENNKSKKLKWTKENIAKYLQEKFQLIDTSKSIFDFGINSLQIVEFRNFICQDICQIPKNFLYEYSSIDQMTQKLFEFIQSDSIENEMNNNDPYHYQLTEEILEKYISLMKSNLLSKKKTENKERIFLLTGGNGSLGCFILRDLLSQSLSNVKCVYCLLRGTNTKERLFESFQQRQLDCSSLEKSLNDKRLIILTSSMNLSDEYLGQTQDIYEELKEQLTDIIHSAWKMNFNQTIKDFEYDSILGVYNLLKLSSYNQIQFHFISSISSASSGLYSIIKEEPLPRQVQIALPQGYGQSKYTSEHLCWAANQFWNVPVNIYRVGQISGDTQHGIWNSTEMAAMMIYAGAGQLHKMPNIGSDLNWIPVDICSSALVELALKSSDQHVYHLLNPHCIDYENYLNSLRESGLQFDIVSKEDFLNSILTTNDLTNPLIKLSSFLEQIYNKKDNTKSTTEFETMKTVEQSQVLKNCPPIDSNLIKLYLNYWKNSKVLKENN